MKLIISILMLSLVFIASIDFEVQAQRGEVPVLTFGLQIASGMLLTWGGTVAGQILPFSGNRYWVGTLSGTIGVGLTGLLLGHNGNWITAYLGSMGGWILGNFFTTGFFDPNGTSVIPFLGTRMRGADLIFLSTLLSTALFAAAAYNI